MGRIKTPVFILSKLGGGCRVEGPAIIMEQTSTTVIEPDCTAHVTLEGNIRIDVRAFNRKPGRYFVVHHDG